MPDDPARITERFRSIASEVLSAELTVDPWFYSYCGHAGTPDGAERYVRYHLDLRKLAGAQPGEQPVIIDAGCGFGLTMVLDALLGARAVRGIELNPDMVSAVESYMPLLPDDVASRMEVFNGSVTDMPYQDASTDLLLSVEAISHYLDVDAFIAEAHRVLRPGGTLLISDGNNACNPLVRQRIYKIWEAAERGPADQNVHGHVLGSPYVEVRQKVLERHFSELGKTASVQLATRSAGFTEEQLIVAGRDYLVSGALPDSVYQRRQLAIAPDGTAMERLFSPWRLVRDLGRRGFAAKAYGYWGGANGVPSIRAANRVLTALSPVTMPTAPSFRVVAYKLTTGRARRHGGLSKRSHPHKHHIAFLDSRVRRSTLTQSPTKTCKRWISGGGIETVSVRTRI